MPTNWTRRNGLAAWKSIGSKSKKWGAYSTGCQRRAFAPRIYRDNPGSSLAMSWVAVALAERPPSPPGRQIFANVPARYQLGPERVRAFFLQPAPTWRVLSVAVAGFLTVARAAGVWGA